MAGSDETLHGQIAAWATRDPGRPAIVAAAREPLSYGALIERIEAVRSFLERRAVGRHDRVAVLMAPGPEAAIAALGVASGAACVPLDPLAGAELESALTQTRAGALLVPTGAGATERSVAKRLGLPLFEGSPDPDGPAGHLHLDGGRATRGRRSTLAGPDDIAFVLRTSGSTGRPKVVPATHRQLVARADKTRRLLGLTPDDRCLCPMPLCYAHGLYSGVTAPLLSGGSTILPPAFDEGTFLGALTELSPTWYTAGATHQQAILGWLRRNDDVVAGHSLRFARSGAASLPVAVLGELEGLAGVPVVEAYSATETGIITANSPDGARTRGSVGASPDGDVAVADRRGAPVAPGVPGEVVVRGPTVFSGYEGDPELNRRSFRDGWYRTGDRGVRDRDGFLTLTGRIGEVINRGGEKVSPAEVEAALLEHPEVDQAVVFPVPHPTLGEDVAAAVRLRASDGPREAALRQFARERLAGFKVPRRILVTDQLPSGATGKPLRKGLARHFGLGPVAPEAPAPPGDSTPMQRLLLGLWREVLELENVGLDDDFFALGGDSLSALELLAALEEELQLNLALEDLVEMPTARELARGLERPGAVGRHARGTGRDLVGVNTEGTRTPLFGVGGRGGHTLRLLLIGRELGGEQPLYGLQPPGMDWERAGCRTIPEMAAHYIGRLRSVQPHGPYRLLGQSFGGLIAFEIALQLERGGERVEFLGIVDTQPATCRWDGSTHTAPTPSAEDDEEALPPDHPLSRSAIAVSESRVTEAHIHARASYRMEDRFQGDLTFFRATGEAVPAGGDRRRLWEDATTGRFLLLALPGLHCRFDREPQFSAFRAGLRACLAGEPPAGEDPATVFERTYRLERGADGEAIRAHDGTVIPVRDGAARGRLAAVKSARGRLILRGWASDRELAHPAQTVVAFVDDRYVGLVGCGDEREKLARTRSAPGLRHAGFRMILPLPPGELTPDRVRALAISAAGEAGELPRRDRGQMS